MRQTRAVQTLLTEDQQHNVTLSDKQKAKNTRAGTQVCSKLIVVLHYSYKTRPVLFLKLKKPPNLEISFWDLTYYTKNISKLWGVFLFIFFSQPRPQELILMSEKYQYILSFFPPSPFILPSPWSYLNFWRASMGGYTSILKLNLLQQTTDGINLSSFNKGHRTLLIGSWSMLSLFFFLFCWVWVKSLYWGLQIHPYFLLRC